MVRRSEEGEDGVELRERGRSAGGPRYASERVLTTFSDSAKSRLRGRAWRRIGRTCDRLSAIGTSEHQIETHLVERDGIDVLEDHTSDGTARVVPRIIAPCRQRRRELEERVESPEDREVLRTEVRLGVEDEGPHRKRSVALHLGLGVGERLEEEGEEGGGEGRDSGFHPVDNFGEGTDGSRSVSSRSLEVL